jgi:hypothetical protein
MDCSLNVWPQRQGACVSGCGCSCLHVALLRQAMFRRQVLADSTCTICDTESAAQPKLCCLARRPCIAIYCLHACMWLPGLEAGSSRRGPSGFRCASLCTGGLHEVYLRHPFCLYHGRHLVSALHSNLFASQCGIVFHLLLLLATGAAQHCSCCKAHFIAGGQGESQQVIGSERQSIRFAVEGCGRG